VLGSVTGGIRAGFTLAATTLWLSCPLPVDAQGTLSVMETGGNQPLVTDAVLLQTAGSAAPMVDFDFGFVTDETPLPGVLLDSFTVSFLNASSDVAVVATIDASGTDWEPTSPGAVTLTGNEVQWQTITPPSQSPVLGQGVAYAVQVSLPPSFAGLTVTADFDLFDNENNTTMALGWFQNVQVVPVPEPSAAACLVLGLGMYLIRRRINM
jgi:hypothetical protein